MTILHQFLRAVEVRHTDLYASQTYLTEPKSASLLGIKRMLLHYGVQAKGVRVAKDSLSQVPYPYLMHSGDDFYLVRKAADVTDALLERFDGIVLYVHDKDKACEPDYRKHVASQLIRKAMYAVLLLMPLVSAAYGGELSILALGSVMGVAVCFLLLQKQLGASSRMGDRICSLVQKNGCDDVLASAQAKIGGILSLSEIGLGYFLAQLLLLGAGSPVAVPVGQIALVGMLFPLWSIYSQWRLKSWCGLCLLTQVVLLVQGLCVLYRSSWSEMLVLDVLLLAFAALVVVMGVIGVHLIAESFSNRYAALAAQWNIRKTMRRQEVFNALIQTSSQHDYLAEDVSECLGNKESSLRVAIYMSHSCVHCKALEPEIDEFVAKHGDRFAVEKIYADDVDEEANKVFIERTGFNGTPTILINGYELPPQSKISDLSYVL